MIYYAGAILYVSRETIRRDKNAMPFVPFVNTAKLELVYRWDNQIVENVLHYQTTQAPTVGIMEQLAGAVSGLWNLYLKPLQTSSSQLTAIKVTSLVTDNAPGIEYTSGLPVSGTGSAASVPNNVAVVVKWTTALRGRSYRGRTYHLGIPQASVSASALTSGYRTSLLQAWGNFVIVGTNPTWNLVVASRFTNNQPREIGLATVVNGLSINPTVDSQRRRLPERGL